MAASSVCRGGIWQMRFRSSDWTGATRNGIERGRHASARYRWPQQLCSDKIVRCGPSLCHPPCGLEAMGKLIDAVKTVGGILVGHDLARVNVGPQIVTRHAVKLFSGQDIFGGQLLRLVQPAPDAGLCHAKVAGHLAIASCGLLAFRQCFKAGHTLHIRIDYTDPYNVSTGKFSDV